MDESLMVKRKYQRGGVRREGAYGCSIISGYLEYMIEAST